MLGPSAAGDTPKRRRREGGWTVCALLVLASTFVPASHELLERIAGTRGAFALGTILLLTALSPLPLLWPAPGNPLIIRRRPVAGAIVVFTGLAVLAWTASRLLPAVFAGPLDPNRGDMLVIIQHAIAKFLDGGNPYAIHQVPWDAPLSYGPVLWLPFIVPFVLKVDPRILTLATQLAIPAIVFLAAARRAAANTDWIRCVVLLAVGTLLALNPDIMRFHAIGQTQIYWPLLLVFSALVVAEKWTAAAICLGLLVAARTTMISIVPVFFLYLIARRLLAGRHVVAFVLAAALPFLPFVVAAPGTVWYAMVGVYLSVMKTFVWQSTSWAIDTYGITGRLLERGLARYVELVQLLSMIVVYAIAWRSMKRGVRPEPWLAIALLVFSMTTLWSVTYLYFDVWILSICMLVAADAFAPLATRNIIATTAGASVVALAVVLTAAAWRPGSHFTLDIGHPAYSGYTGGGFGRDEAVVDEGRTVVWVEGETARIRLPRAGWTGASIRISLRPHAPGPGYDQRVSASLNGRAIGSARLENRWQDVTFTTSSRDWTYGFNVLDLTFSYAAQKSGDNRALSAAIDAVTVE